MPVTQQVKRVPGDQDCASFPRMRSPGHRPTRLPRFIPHHLASFRFAILLLFMASMMVTVMAIVYKISERAESVVYELSSRIVDEIGEKIVACATGILRVTGGHLLSNAAVAAATPLIPSHLLAAA